MLLEEPTKDLNEDGDLRESASRRPSVCLAIPVLPHRWAQKHTP